MNKKVLTLCAAMLLGSSLTSIYAEGVSVKDFDNYKEGVVYVESTKTLTFNEDVTIDDYHNYLLISDDNVIVDGQNHALDGHIVVTGKNVTIKNLTVNYNNGFTETEDGTLTVNKTAISVFSDKVTIEGCTINCSSDLFLANGISIFPTSADTEITLTNNTINNANQERGGDLATGIQIVEGYTYDYTGLEDAQKPEGTSGVMTNFDATALINNNTVNNSTTDITYIDYTEGTGGTKAIEVEPYIDAEGTYVNAKSIKSLLSAPEDAVVRFDGSSHDLLIALQNVEANLDDVNAAIQCTEDKTNVIFGDATPTNDWTPVNADEYVGEDGNVTAPIQEPAWGEYGDLVADGTSAKIVLIHKGGAVKAISDDAAEDAGSADVIYTLGQYRPSSTDEENLPSQYQFTLTPVETARGTYEVRLQDCYGRYFSVNNVFVTVDNVQVTEGADGSLLWNNLKLDGKNAVIPTELTLKAGNQYVTFDMSSSEFGTVGNIYDAQAFGTAEISQALMYAEDLLKRFGEYFTLGVTYKYTENGVENEVDLTSIFKGELTPVQWNNYNSGSNWYTLANPKDRNFMLINEDNMILALNTNPETAWSAGTATHAYRLELISAKQYAEDIAKGENYYKTTFSFEYTPGTDASKVTEITNVYVLDGTTWREIGCYLDSKKVPSLAGQGNIGSLIDVEFELNASGAVNAQTWLTSPSYYKIEVANVNKKAQHYGKVLGLTESGVIDYVAPTKTNINLPEGQFAITYDAANDIYTFTNRENQADNFTLRGADLYTTGTANVFAYRDYQYNLMDTLKITPVTQYTSADGFRRISPADLNANTYEIALNTIAGPLYVIENHNDKHRIGLDAEEATAWRIEQPTVRVMDIMNDFDHYAADTVSVLTPISYYIAGTGWVNTQISNPKAKYYAPNTELQIPVYVLKNTATDEYFDGKDYTEEAGNAYYVCNEDEKTATRLALKLAGDSTVALVPVYNYANYQPWNWTSNMEVNETSYDSYAAGLQLSDNKVIGGTTAIDGKGVLKDVALYSATSNDLFVISKTGARTYKLLNQDDKIAISLMENNDEVIYEDGEFANIDNDQAYDINPTLYVDTAYINRPGNYRYDYLLSVRPLRVDSIESCNNPNHEHPRTTFTEGDFLVVMRDSMDANKDVHNNIYAYNEQPRLAFVPGIHQNDTLYYTDAAGKIIDKEEVGNAKYSFAKFAFKMIDEANNEFVIETAYNYTPVKWVNGEPVEYEVSKGYLRWDNSFLVVTPNLDDAEHFTMEASELDATANEEISAENAAVSVVATDGAVIIKGAEGKNVVIATILGKVVANETVNSDNETIAVPAGIAVVSVDGESFKVVVK